MLCTGTVKKTVRATCGSCHGPGEGEGSGALYKSKQQYRRVRHCLSISISPCCRGMAAELTLQFGFAKLLLRTGDDTLHVVLHSPGTTRRYFQHSV